MPTDREVRFVKTAVTRKLCTKEQIEDCVQLRKEMKREGKSPPSLANVLVQQKCLTVHQVEMIERSLDEESNPQQAPASANDTASIAASDGQIINGYEILKRIDKGAMGTVYKARQISMDRIVAMKILSKKLTRDQEFVERYTVD